MAVTVRPADVETEQDLLCTLLEQNLGALAHRARYPWLYLANPAGQASSWVAEDTDRHRAIGIASVFPRRIWIGERPGICGQVGDFAVDVGYRSLGPAVMLQRATLEPVQRGTLDFCYDCPPDERGMAPFRRLGMAATCHMTRYVRLLRCDRQLEKRLGRNPLSGVLALIGNGVLSLRRRRRPPSTGIEIRLHAGRFGEEFSELDRRCLHASAVRCRRSAEDLNWRYREDPLHSYEVLTAHRGGALAGYAVLASTEHDTLLIDLFGEPAAGVTSALLEAAVDRAGGAATQTLQALVAHEPSLAELLTHGGFRLRSHGPHVVAHARQGTDVHTLLDSRSSWLLRHADILA